MRLLHTDRLELELFEDSQIPRYAILSHTWGDEEVTFQEIQQPIPEDIKKKSGFIKIEQACARAKAHGLDHIWIDTCCIEKASSSELSEAINSMGRWYQNAEVCIAYLADVSQEDLDDNADSSPFHKSRWFTRGWTLQELLLPRRVFFYAKDWSVLAERRQLAAKICQATGIDADILVGKKHFSSVSVAKRMSWAANRQTSKIEDMAYCLLGIFGLSMPILYGEGKRAFIRLQEEILRETDDQSLLAWGYTEDQQHTRPLVGVLAESPAAFASCGNIVPCQPWKISFMPNMTGRGLCIDAPLCPVYIYVVEEISFAMLRCRFEDDHRNVLGIPLVGTPTSQESGEDFFRVGRGPLQRIPRGYLWRAQRRTVYIRKNASKIDDRTFYNLWNTPPRLLVRAIPNRCGYNLVNAFPKTWDPQQANFHMTPDINNTGPKASILLVNKREEKVAIFYGNQRTLLGALITIPWAMFLWLNLEDTNCFQIKDYYARGPMRPRSFLEEVKLAGVLFLRGGPGQLFPKLVSDIKLWEPWCHVTNITNRSTSNGVSMDLSDRMRKKVPWWPTNRIKVSNHWLEATVIEETAMGDLTVIGDVHCFSERAYLRMRVRYYSTLFALIAAGIVEWRSSKKLDITCTLLPIAAVILGKVRLWSHDLYTLHWKSPLVLAAYITPLVFQLLKMYYFRERALLAADKTWPPLWHYAILMVGFVNCFSYGHMPALM